MPVGENVGQNVGEYTGSNTNIIPSQVNEVVLSWNIPTDPDLAGFRIYRGTDAVNNVMIVDLPSPAANTYTDTGLYPNTYYYYLSSYDNAGNESAKAGPIIKVIT